MPKYCISDIIFDLYAPEMALHNNLQSFICNSGNPDVYCKVIFEENPALSLTEEHLILKIEGTKIYEHQGNIYNRYGNEQDIPSLIVASENLSKYILYIAPEFYGSKDEETVNCIKNGVAASLRDIMMAILAKKKGLLIHSCSIMWQGQGVLFSAPSGTGKTTHANLWGELYNTEVLDGDVTACRIVDGHPFVYGLPWCGSSGEFINRSVPLRAVVFLQQADENSIKKLSVSEAFVRLTAGCLTLRWNSTLMELTLNTVQCIAEQTDCYLLKCRPDFDAVELVKNCLEKK